MLTVTTCLWDSNEHTEWFSEGYDASWALKFFNGFRRNLKTPHRSILFTEKPRDLPDWIEQVVDPETGDNGYGDCIRPFSLNEPMIFAGLDTIVTGNCDKFARWCLEHPGKLALPKHPQEDWSINGVVFWGGGNPAIWGDWRGENDMKWLRAQEHVRINELWPGKVKSYRAEVLPKGLGDARVVYFHGAQKAPDIVHNTAWARDAWR